MVAPVEAEADLPSSTGNPLSGLAKALAIGVEAGDFVAVSRWLERELDPEGVPLRLPVSLWPEVLERLARTRLDQPGAWPAQCEAWSEGLLRSILRFGRPEGSLIFGPAGRDLAHLAHLRSWAEDQTDPALVAVTRRWLPDRREASEPPGPPPLPAHACRDRPLAILRPDWSSRGDWLAIDHRARGGHTLLELAGRGRRLLGSSWTSGATDSGLARLGDSRLTFWKTGAEADLVEWSFATTGGRVVRLALLLRGRGLALLADQVEGRPGGNPMGVSLPPGVTAKASADGRGVVLASGRGATARVLPLAMPSNPDSSGPGGLHCREGSIHWDASNPGSRAWLPLLVSWSPERNRRPVRWFPLTVTENSRICPPEVAFATRVAWGRDEGLVIYRSLGPPGLRTFLGHQTRARFLVGRFARDGIVRPLVKIDEQGTTGFRPNYRP